MQLKQIKYIRNNHCLPGFTEGADAIKFQMSDDKKVWLDQYSPVESTPHQNTEQYEFNYLKDSVPNTFKMPTSNYTPQNKSPFNLNKALGKAGGIASSALGAFSAINNAFHAPVKSENQMNSEAGFSSQSINGVSTQLQNDIDTAGQVKQINAENQANTLAAAGAGAQVGQKVGSLLGPIGGIVGGVVGGIGGFVSGIFGGKNRKRKLMARIRTGNINNSLGNNQRLSYANTQGLQQQYDSEHANTEDDLLYANFGKSSLRMIKYVK